MTKFSSKRSNDSELPAFLDEGSDSKQGKSKRKSGASAASSTGVATSSGPDSDGDAPAADPSAVLTAEPLVEFTSDVGSIASFLPDTPWTTTVVHACERRRARVWVDSVDMPQNVVVLVPGDPDHELPPTAYLFGSESDPNSLVRYVNDFEGPLDVVCDDAVGAVLAAVAPELEQVDHAVRWFERLDTVERPDLPGLRRLRLRDEEAVNTLPLPGLLRTFETVKDVLMGGGASGVINDGVIQAAAFTVDQTVNYARILMYVSDAPNAAGLGAASARHIVAAHHEQGRLACIVVRATDAVGESIARTTGFEAAARMTVFQKR